MYIDHGLARTQLSIAAGVGIGVVFDLGELRIQDASGGSVQRLADDDVALACVGVWVAGSEGTEGIGAIERLGVTDVVWMR
jgi:hypothetical protein